MLQIWYICTLHCTHAVWHETRMPSYYRILFEGCRDCESRNVMASLRIRRQKAKSHCHWKWVPPSLCTVSVGPSPGLWFSRKQKWLWSPSSRIQSQKDHWQLPIAISFISEHAVTVFSKSNTWIQKSNTSILEFKRYLNLSKLIMIVIVKQYPKFDVSIYYWYLVHYFVLYFRVVTSTSDPFFDLFWLKWLNTLNNKALY